ncbi:molybdenum cofactor guanylyltransferase [Agromyces marinus]|uniref:molybdenum cofactor guanylyltransferase n=1 Tax=Agromyces marinus TaxID=1389020 RepID=UPI003D9AC315
MRVDGDTILERVVAASAAARHRIVVGEAGASRVPPEVRIVREEPPFGGPAAAVATGVASLPAGSDAVLLLAGDLPFAAEAIEPLLAALETDAAADGARAVDASGRAQHLLGVIRRPALEAAIAARGPLAGSSMRGLLADLRMIDTPVPVRATMDVDTWADARRVGATGGADA